MIRMTPISVRCAFVGLWVALQLFATAGAMAAECRYDVDVIDAIASELSVTIECDGGLPNSFAMFEGATDWTGPMDLSNGGNAEQTAWCRAEGRRYHHL